MTCAAAALWAFVTLLHASAVSCAVGALPGAHLPGEASEPRPPLGHFAGEPAPPWTVFTVANSGLPMSANLLLNPGFEQGPAGSADHWQPYGAGYTVDATGGRTGGRALQLVNPTATATHGASQVIVLNQTAPTPLYFSAWSKAANVTGEVNSDYSLYLDVIYSDGTPLWGQTLDFDPGTHDWQFREGFIVPARPISYVSVYCLLRSTHSGTAWFDDLAVKEVQVELVNFDGVQVAVSQPITPPFGGAGLALTTGDGLSLTLASAGGAVTGLALDGQAVHDPAHAYAAGFFVHDVAGQSDFIHVGGLLTPTGNVVVHQSALPALDLTFAAVYTATTDRIAVHATLADTRGQDRGLTLYFALPVLGRSWTWGDNIRAGREVTGLEEFANLTWLGWEVPVGATGQVSRYPWASLTPPSSPALKMGLYRPLTGIFDNPLDCGLWRNGNPADCATFSSPPAPPCGPGERAGGEAGVGLALAIPLDQPRVARLVHNPVTNQFYVAFDLGLSPLTVKSVLNEVNGFPGQASVDLVIYPTPSLAEAGPGERSGAGFRAAAQGYYDRFPAAFQRRIPAGQEGIWVAFSDLASITDTADFGIAFHELGSLDQVAFDDAAGILSFRYIAEPWSHWLPIEDPTVDPNDYDQVIAYLHDRYEHGEPWEHDRAEATLGSGFFDDAGRYRYESIVAPWCAGVAGCAVFTVNPDPDVADPTYPLNKARLEWNQAARETYTTTPGLDGEYVDSFLGRAEVLDFRPGHFPAADLPLAYRIAGDLVGTPELFATYEFAQWLTDDVHDNLGRWTMANGILADRPWGADLFDFMGLETNWLWSGSFTPDSDAEMSYRRTLAYQRPYGLLMNTDFDNLSYDLVERYFQVCLFYGIYPGMFSHDAATARYWDDPALYNRDRPLFRRYIPLIRRLNAAGWQPITRGAAAPAEVYVERFGTWPRLHLTLRNTLDVAVTAAVTVEAQALGLPAVPLIATALLAGTAHPLSAPGPTRTLTIALGPQASEALYLTCAAADLDGDCDVDVLDVQNVAARWGVRAGQAAFDPHFDLDNDGDVDAADVQQAVGRWGGGGGGKEE
jgi:hypothetical protein